MFTCVVLKKLNQIRSRKAQYIVQIFFSSYGRRETEKERKREREGGRERGRERVYDHFYKQVDH